MLVGIFHVCRGAVGGSVGCPDPDLDHATARRCREKGRQGDFLYLDRAADRREDRQGLPGSLSRHLSAGRAQRLRAPVPASRRGTRQQYPRCRCNRVLGHDGASLLEAAGLVGALCAGRRGGEMAGRSARSRRLFRDRAVYALADHVQHEACQGRGCTKELRRPARQEMDRQDRQGPSRLQRYDHDRNLRAEPRPRLGLSEETRSAARDAGAVGGGAAQKGGTGRAPDRG